MRITELRDCELELLLRVREATYGGEGTPSVYYDDGNAWADITDLYQVLPTQKPDGTKNLENGQVEAIARDYSVARKPLNNTQIGLLKGLLAKYDGAIKKLRASPEHDDYTTGPDPATARLGG
jgi:hypothetical protein